MKWLKFLICLPLLLGVIQVQASGFCAPLHCGHFGAKIKGSLDYFHYTFDDPDILIIPSAPSGFVSSSHDQSTFKTPWTVGLEVEYALSNSFEIFGEVDFSFSKGKKRHLTYGTTFSSYEDFSRYGAISGYIGGRYYFPRSCWGTSFFLGAKAGIVNYLARRYDVKTFTPSTFDFNKQNFTKTSIVPSAGLHVGVDFLLCEGFSIDVMAEVIFASPPQPNAHLVPIANPFGVTKVVVGTKGPILSYPISIGVRKVF